MNVGKLPVLQSFHESFLYVYDHKQQRYAWPDISPPEHKNNTRPRENVGMT